MLSGVDTHKCMYTHTRTLISHFQEAKHTSIMYCHELVLHGQTLYSGRALSSRDEKRPQEKGLEQFTGSTGTAISAVVMGVDCIVVF